MQTALVLIYKIKNIPLVLALPFFFFKVNGMGPDSRQVPFYQIIKVKSPRLRVTGRNRQPK